MGEYFFFVPDRSKVLQYNTENNTDLGCFIFARAGLLLPPSSISSSELIWGLAGQPSQSFHSPAQLQHPDLGRQRQLLHSLATPQCTAALGFIWGPVVCDGLPECGTNLWTSLVSLHQHQGGLQRVRGLPIGIICKWLCTIFSFQYVVIENVPFAFPPTFHFSRMWRTDLTPWQRHLCIVVQRYQLKLASLIAGCAILSCNTHFVPQGAIVWQDSSGLPLVPFLFHASPAPTWTRHVFVVPRVRILVLPPWHCSPRRQTAPHRSQRLCLVPVWLFTGRLMSPVSMPNQVVVVHLASVLH